jgi:hypothetical protein
LAAAEMIFVNPLWGAVRVLQNVVSDGGPDNGRNCFGGAFFGANGCLDCIIGIVDFNLGLGPGFELVLLVDASFLLGFDDGFLGLGEDGFSSDSISRLDDSESIG